MSKKLMLLVAGALAALAFTALPGAASAEEKKLTCDTGAPCEYTVSGGESRFSAKGGDTVWCSSVSGTGEMTNLVNGESSTGQVRLLFHSCREQATIFHFLCTSSGQASGTITTNLMVTHNVSLPTLPNKQGVLLTGANTTFTCAGGFARTTVTGNVLGELHEACGQTKNTVKLNFTASSHGVQTPVEYTGAKYDLEAATNHEETPKTTTGYETAAQTGTGTLTFNQNVKPTC